MKDTLPILDALIGRLDAVPAGADWLAERETLAGVVEAWGEAEAIAERGTRKAEGRGPGVAASWARPVSEWLDRLAGLSESRSDADWLAAVEALRNQLSDLLPEMDVAALADVFERGMSAAVLRAARATLAKAERTKSFAADDSLGIDFLPLAQAIAKLDRKTPVGARLTSAEWAQVPLMLRERAQFSARVESVRFLAEIQDQLDKRLKLAQEERRGGQAYINRDSFIRHMRDRAQAWGVDTTGGDPERRGGLRDIRSAGRLGLVYDMQTAQATGFAGWKIGQDRDVLDAFPAQRFERVESRENPRPAEFWPARWAKAGAEVGWSGAVRSPMVALKTSPIWAALSIFGTPWPPFDWGSGMGLVDVDRDAAESLGLVPAGGEVPQAGGGEADFNRDLQASVEDLSPEMREALENEFGDQIRIRDGVARWAGDNGIMFEPAE